ncbi:MAG: acyl-CoA dehydrogenase family protein [Anaerolineales bacterium]|nr:acyl-CoA dehydrogenase family protein [Anaerolineales bacterium]
MDFRKTEEQELLLESLDELLNRVAPEAYIAKKDEAHEPLTEVLKALYDNGFAQLGIPEEFGGTPCDNLTLAMLSEEIGRHGLPALLGNMVSIKDILDFGNAEQQKAVLELVAQGKPGFSLGISEPQAGSDVTAIRTTATREGDTVIFNGVKTFQTGSQGNKYTLLLTRDLDNPKPHQAMSMWLVPMDLPGISVHPLRKVAWWWTDTNEVYFDNVRAPASCLVGREGNGFMQLMANFEVERLLMAASALGIAEAAFEDACRYANQRVQFGQPIGRFQLIQEKIANMAVKIENMRNIVYRTAWLIDNKIPANTECAMAKLYCAQAGFEICDNALQIFGGMGLMMDLRIQRLWRDMRVNRIGGGTDEIMITIIAKDMLKKYQ